MRQLRILHLVAGDGKSGAAKGALSLHQGLLEIGQESEIVFSRTPKTQRLLGAQYLSDYPFFRFRAKARNGVERIFRALFLQDKSVDFSSGFFGENIKKMPGFLNADVIHLHWINESMIDLKSIQKIDKPIVWTLRDMWPMTGGCHYAISCGQFENGCKRCQLLATPSIIKLFAQRKHDAFKESKVVICAISTWLATQAMKSMFFQGATIEHLPNCISVGQFNVIAKREARKKLEINTKKKIILIGAMNASRNYKGGPIIEPFLEKLDCCKFSIAAFGNVNFSQAIRSKFEIFNFGLVENSESLCLIYNAADIFISFSIQEAFGKTIAEALACGTPALAFSGSGPDDIVEHKKFGYLATNGDILDLHAGLYFLINQNYRLEDRLASHQRIREKFGHKEVAAQYSKLYSSLVC